MIKLKIGDRYRIIAIINEFKGNIETLSSLMDDVKKIKISEEEWRKAKLERTPIIGEDGQPTGGENLKWDDTLVPDLEVELEKDTLKYLNENLKAKSDNNEFTVNDFPLIELFKKLK